MGRVRGSRVHGAAAIAQRLVNLGQVSNSTTREAMRQGAEAIKDLAQDYAPRDTAALEKAIVVKSETGPNGRKVLVIGIDESRTNPKTNQSVGKYAEEVHENYDAREPGPGTQAKRAAGLDAGARFLFRAAIELEPKIMKRVRDAIARALSRKK